MLLQGNAVNYTVNSQNAEGLSFGDWQQIQPPRLPRDIAGLVEKGVAVYLVADDVSDRGLNNLDRVSGTQLIPRSNIAGLVDKYDQVWRW